MANLDRRLVTIFELKIENEVAMKIENEVAMHLPFRPIYLVLSK